MTWRALAFGLFAACGVVAASSAHDTPDPPRADAPIKGAKYPQLLLPLGRENGAWVVQIESSGGFDGRGGGHNFAISSENATAVSSDQGLSRRAVARDLIARLRQRVLALSSSGPTEQHPSACGDCIRTTLVIVFRTGAEDAVQIRTKTAAWDQTTEGKLSPQVRALYYQAIQIRDAALQDLPTAR